MRKPMVAGNWKMYGSNPFVIELLSALKEGAATLPNVELVVCPPFVFLELTRELLSGSPIKWGAQNVYPALQGAYTGEISPLMLKDFQCEYVIVGHSERRHMGETIEQVAEKFSLAAECGLRPILCVGETQDQRQAGRTYSIIAEQLEPIIRNPGNLPLLQNAVVAYEPVWAIGTGLTATPSQAQEVHAFIRKEIRKIDKTLAENLRILYGGSVKQNNARALFSMPDIDGGLVGGASLNSQEFLEIAKSCN
jgi:triosephosphate isomerase (TIM)